MAENPQEDYTRESSPWENLEPLLEGLEVNYKASDAGPRLIEGVVPRVVLPKHKHKLNHSHTAQQLYRPPLEFKLPSTHAPVRASFLGLPAELRLKVYQHLLVSKNNSAQHPFFFFHLPDSFCGILPLVAPFKEYYHASGVHPEILATCRWIHCEATPVLYQENVFAREGYRSFPTHWWCCCGTNSMGAQRHSPLRGEYPKGSQSSALISRIHLNRTAFNNSLGGADDHLTIVKDYPALKELTLDGIELNDFYKPVFPYGYRRPENYQELTFYDWHNVMRLIGRRQPPMKRLECRVNITKGIDGYSVWDPVLKAETSTKYNYSSYPTRRDRADPVDFGHHLSTKQNLEGWMEANQLFAGLRVGWEFELRFDSWNYEYRMPVFFIGTVVRPGILCRVQGGSKEDYQEFLYKEPETES